MEIAFCYGCFGYGFSSQVMRGNECCFNDSEELQSFEHKSLVCSQRAKLTTQQSRFHSPYSSELNLQVTGNMKPSRPSELHIVLQCYKHRAYCLHIHVHNSYRDIMTSIPVPHPPFINWPVQVDLTSGGRELLTDSVTAMLTGKNKTRSDYPHLLAKMNKRCTAGLLQQQLSGLQLV